MAKKQDLTSKITRAKQARGIAQFWSCKQEALCSNHSPILKTQYLNGHFRREDILITNGYMKKMFAITTQ
jgi:hypothetical protein